MADFDVGQVHLDEFRQVFWQAGDQPLPDPPFVQALRPSMRLAL